MAIEREVNCVVPVSGEPSGLLVADDRRRLLRFMLLTRAVEERGLLLYKQGKVPGSFYTGRGQEAIGVGATYALRGADAVCSPLIRDLGAHLVRGTDLADIFRHCMGRESELTHGRDGNVHFGDRRLGVVGMVSMLPDMMLVACGLAMAFKMRGEARCALSFFGDGASSRGDCHEAMNWAAVQRLPVILLLENNQFAFSTPNDRQFAVDPLARAQGYGIPAERVDGNDVEAVFAATMRARDRAVRGEGPSLIGCETMRMQGHGAHDDMRYVPTELLDRWRARDPIEGYQARLAGLGIEHQSFQAQVAEEVESALELALRAPMPPAESALEGVFCDGEPEPLGTGPTLWSGYRDSGVADAQDCVGG
jgi:TPP-dependent pyruvate/acetoin dehydrogenase alpha subunit